MIEIRELNIFNIIFKSDLYILDNSKEEGAHYIYNLNEIINNKSIEGKFDLIIDPRTSQHIFDLKYFIIIFFSFKKRGFKLLQMAGSTMVLDNFLLLSFLICVLQKESLSLNQLYVFHRDRKKLTIFYHSSTQEN